MCMYNICMCVGFLPLKEICKNVWSRTDNEGVKRFYLILYILVRCHTIVLRNNVDINLKWFSVALYGSVVFIVGEAELLYMYILPERSTKFIECIILTNIHFSSRIFMFLCREKWRLIHVYTDILEILYIY